MKKLFAFPIILSATLLFFCSFSDVRAETNYLGEFCVNVDTSKTVGSLTAQLSSNPLYKFGVYYNGNNHFALHGNIRDGVPEPLYGSGIIDPGNNFVATLASAEITSSGLFYRVGHLSVNLGSLDSSGKFSGALSTLDLSWQPGGVQGTDIPIQLTLCGQGF